VRTVALSDVASINPKWSPNAKPDDAVSFVGMAHLSDEQGRVVAEEIRRVSDVRTGYTPFEANDLLVAKITPCFENGKIGRATISETYGAGSTEFHVVRPGPDLDERYALHFLRRPHFRASGKLRMTGSGGQRRVPAEYVAGTKIPLPPLDEQRRIADILDTADTLRAKRRESIARLDTLSLAIFHDMFSDKSLQTVELADLVLSTQLGLSRSSSEFGLDYSHPYVRMDAISDSGRFIPTKVLRTDATALEREKYEVIDGDFLMNTRNSEELVGKAAVVRGLGKGLFNNNLLRIRFKAGVSPDFVSMFMLTNKGKRQVDMRKSGTTSVFAMYQRDYLTIRVPWVEKAEQDLFAKRIAAAERLRSQCLKQLVQLDTLFLALEDRAFKIDP
jgi:type I restriction enzyme S subunit